MAAHPRKAVLIVTATLAFGLLATAPASAAGSLSIKDARKAAVTKVKRLQAKLLDTGATGSAVPGCWRAGKHRVGCLGIVKGADEFVRWRCAVPMMVRKPATASTSSRRLAVKFTDTMCSF